MANTPCKDCSDRQIGCHGICERYKSWNADHIEQNRKIRTEREKDNLYRSYVAETSARNNKRRAHGDKRR